MGWIHSHLNDLLLQNEIHHSAGISLRWDIPLKWDVAHRINDNEYVNNIISNKENWNNSFKTLFKKKNTACCSFSHTLVTIENRTIKSFRWNYECSCSIRNSIVMELTKKVSPNRRVSTTLESMHVDMTLLVSEILLRRVLLSSKIFVHHKKKL